MTAVADDNRVAIECRNLHIRYGGQTALRDVSVQMPRGKISALIGPSGCGKTSFLQTLNRISDMIPDCRVTGAVRLDGVNILENSTDLISLRRRVGMIFQRPNPFPVSVRRNIDLPLKEAGVRSRAERDRIIERVLRDVGLWEEVHDRLGTAAQKLSGGQQQRLCIARALALNPDVLLFDEPCSALDPISSRRVEDLITSLRGRVTIVIVTHNLGQARRIADFVSMFWFEEGSGVLIESGPAQQVFDDPRHSITADYLHGDRG